MISCISFPFACHHRIFFKRYFLRADVFSIFVAQRLSNLIKILNITSYAF